MGGGGYVAGPVALAALSLRIPVVLTEADSRLGLTNRLLAPFARRVCLAFPATAGVSARRSDRYRVTGRPIFPPVQDRGAARERFGIAPDETCVLVFGGSLGARSINLAAIEAFADGSLRVLHICGRRDHTELLERELPAGYDLREYLSPPDFAEALAAADLVVARVPEGPCSRSPRTACPRSSSHTLTPQAITRAQMPVGCAMPAQRSRSPTMS